MGRNQKLFFYLTAVTTLMLSFQNCAKQGIQPLPDSLNASSIVDSTNANPSDTDKISVYNVAASTNTKLALAMNSGSTPTSDQVYRYEIDVKSGIIESYDHGENRVEDKTFCLSPDELSEVKSILETSQLCLAKEEAEESGEKMCTFVYEFPYAVLLLGGGNGREVRLGEKVNGCDIPDDLCGEHSNMLRGFIHSILGDMNRRACNFKEVLKRTEATLPAA